MKILLQPKQILGRVVTITATKGGIIIPENSAKDGSKKKESVLFLIDEIGSGVTNPMCKPGNIVCPISIQNIVLRDREFRIVDEAAVFVGVGELDRKEYTIEGEPDPVQVASKNGAQSDSLQVKRP